MALAKDVGQRIKKLREEMGLTQDAFSRKLKIHSKQLSKYEAGYHLPMLDIIAKMASFCEVPADYIIFGADSELNKKTKINDVELLECFRRVNKLKKGPREKIKWVILGLLDKDGINQQE